MDMANTYILIVLSTLTTSVLSHPGDLHPPDPALPGDIHPPDPALPGNVQPPDPAHPGDVHPPGPAHPGDVHPPDPAHPGDVHLSPEIEIAILHVELSYNDYVCHDISALDCNNINLQSPANEEICGSNGITYDNHCYFAQARCFYILDPGNHDIHQNTHIVLGIKSHGSCAPNSTSTLPTTASVNTSRTTTSLPFTTITTIGTTSISATASVSASRTTTSVPFTTTTTIGPTVMSVFCQLVDAITCPNLFQIMCGSDGQLYPNSCEMRKAQCNDPPLHEVDATLC